MTVREAIRLGQERLSIAQIETSELDATLLLAHLMEQPHLELWLRQSEELGPAMAEKFLDVIQRRSRREPLQHITGWTAFLDMEIHVNRDVLVPRPETEVLAQKAIEFLTQRPTPRKALDWGTGSGCLALALARHVQDCEVTAIDASPDALRVARANATAFRLADKIRFKQGRGVQALEAKGLFSVNEMAFDLIVTNPPYICSEEIPKLEPEVKDYEPLLALDGGTDGMDCYREIAKTMGEWLKADGTLMAEFGDGQARDVKMLFLEQGWTIKGVEKDLSDRERILIVAPPHS